jgi:hypothetical protein
MALDPPREVGMVRTAFLDDHDLAAIEILPDAQRKGGCISMME